MEVGSILQFLDNKSILITGATGFLAKLFVEKVLRVQPNVKKLYLLLRATDSKSATQRFNNEVMGKDVFKVLKEKMGTKLNSMITEKISVVCGDISCEDLGLKSIELKKEMYNELDVIINLAATTHFDERYDVAFGINTLGAKYVMEFAKNCVKIKALLHVSTAYVCGEKSGLIKETPYKMGDSLNGALGLNIDVEKEIIRAKLSQLEKEGATQETITLTMKDLGIERANRYGWPNTYVFTKAMGEMMVGELEGNISLIILRPTIVTSTYKQPFPGWGEGSRTIDSLLIAYGKGRLNCFLGDAKTILDTIPADMVVNAMMVSMVAHASKPSEIIYQVGSSMRNPLYYDDFKNYGVNYFMKKPWTNKNGEVVKVGKFTVLNDMASFHKYLALRYLLPLKGLELANVTFCRSFQGTCNNLRRKFNYVIRLAELYRPYLFFTSIIGDENTENLRNVTLKSGVETDLFYFDPKVINWEEYFMRTHIPGVVKYIFK